MFHKILLASLLITFTLASTPTSADAGIWLRGTDKNGTNTGGAGR